MSKTENGEYFIYTRKIPGRCPWIHLAMIPVLTEIICAICGFKLSIFQKQDKICKMATCICIKI